MEHLYIRKYFSQFLVTIFICCAFSSCISSKAQYLPKNNFDLKIIGQYQKVKSKELLILNDDNTFLCLRNYIQKSDVVVPACDTIAAGFWEKREGFIVLRNKSNYKDVVYSVEESVTSETDSLKFKIMLPQEDALNYDIFRFIVTHISPSEVYRVFDKPEFSIKRKSEYLMFGFSINNIGANSEYGKKSYQRLYFNVFENYKPKNSSSNFFIITLKNFNQCFYEAMDIDGEVLGIEGDSLFWRGNIYKKIK